MDDEAFKIDKKIMRRVRELAKREFRTIKAQVQLLILCGIKSREKI